MASIMKRSGTKVRAFISITLPMLSGRGSLIGIVRVRWWMPGAYSGLRYRWIIADPVSSHHSTPAPVDSANRKTGVPLCGQILGRGSLLLR